MRGGGTRDGKGVSRLTRLKTSRGRNGHRSHQHARVAVQSKIERSAAVSRVLLASQPGGHAGDPGAKVHVFVNSVISIAGETYVIPAIRVGSEFGFKTPSLVVPRSVDARSAIEARCLDLRLCVNRVGRHSGALRSAPSKGCCSQSGKRVDERLRSPQYLKRLRSGGSIVGHQDFVRGGVVESSGHDSPRLFRVDPIVIWHETIFEIAGSVIIL